MQIVLLSGGSGKSLWPLSNDTRSKQFLKCLTAPDGGKESMVQRMVRQLRASGLGEHITVATSLSQKDVVNNQLGAEVEVVTEPERRGTFAAIALACAYLSDKKGCPANEEIIVMPCDTYTGDEYFTALHRIARIAKDGTASLAMVGIRPTYPSAKYGYILSAPDKADGKVSVVTRFTEKPDVDTARRLIAEGGYWNGGIFAFRLGYMREVMKRYPHAATFDEILAHYNDLPKINFDYEVAEKEKNAAVVKYDGEWKDLGTWLTLTEEIDEHAIGNVLLSKESTDTHVINELELPLVCIGTQGLVVTASPDGILVADKKLSEEVKAYANSLHRRPMYEERRWGEYKVIDNETLADGYKALTKQLVVRAGKNISYQVHHHRDEVWTFIDGEGRLILDGVETRVGRGDTIVIKKGVRHAVRAITDLRFIEVQSGDLLIEEDIDRFDWNWD